MVSIAENNILILPQQKYWLTSGKATPRLLRG